MFENLSYTPFEGLILLIIVVFFGQSFRKNWKKQNKGWIFKSWIFGLISSISFFIIILIPMKP